jgi:hypothetical protein
MRTALDVRLRSLRELRRDELRSDPGSRAWIAFHFHVATESRRHGEIKGFLAPCPRVSVARRCENHFS